MLFKTPTERQVVRMIHYNDMNAFYNAKDIECLRKRAWLEDGVLIVYISEPLRKELAHWGG